MTTYAPPLCLNCIHFQEDNAAGDAICAAFPKGIPEAIYFKAGDHTKPWPGDHGIQFEARDETEVMESY